MPGNLFEKKRFRYNSVNLKNISANGLKKKNLKVTNENIVA